MSAEYNESFIAFLRSGGKQTASALSEGFDPMFGGFALPSLPGMSSALYEGSGGSSNGAGGYAVNIPTDGQIIPLAVPDLGVRSVARAIPTATDIKLPSQSTFGTAGIKAESGATTNAFVEDVYKRQALTRVDFLGIMWEQDDRDPRAKGKQMWITEFADDKRAALEMVAFKNKLASMSAPK